MIPFDKARFMNAIHPNKLKLSKWTARQPQHREKHFLVTKVSRDEKGGISSCQLEAVISKKIYHIDWRQLRDSKTWLQGWQ
ncbi:TIGR02450 family Trp-rich protein [Methylophaga sp.]|uniref:TIGR02450 family Trp-rich protein n=1 Tax=Methylophaga sp. TaxID=2024840 RepID=UPI0025DCF9B3|nr:TIGR02450 family Trp-rich protein [Methylophaga sp.]